MPLFEFQCFPDKIGTTTEILRALRYLDPELLLIFWMPRTEQVVQVSTFGGNYIVEKNAITQSRGTT